MHFNRIGLEAGIITTMAWNVSETQLKDLLEHSLVYFELGNLQTFEQVGGNANKNFEVLTDKGEYILKIVLEHTGEDLELEVQYQKRLQENHFPAAFYLPAPNGSRIFTYEDKSIVAMSKVEGEYPNVSKETAAQLGRDLAKLHMVSSEGLSSKKSWLNPDYLSTAMTVITTHFPQRTKFVDVFKTLGDFPYQSLPQTIVHGDLNQQNCLLSGNQMTYLDWEETGTAPAILDLGMTFMNFCCDDSGMRMDLINDFVEAYQTVRPLSAIERKYLGAATQYAAFTISVWALLQFGLHHPNPENMQWADLYWECKLETFKLEI